MTQHLHFRRLLFFAALLFILAVLPATNVRVTEAAVDIYPRSNPLSGDEVAIHEGARLYFKWCVQCHGGKADGKGVRFIVGADLTKFWRGYCDYVVIVLNGRTDKQMPPWGGILDEEEISSIGAYLETLAKENALWKGRCTLL